MVVYWESDGGYLRYREFEDLAAVKAFLDRIDWQALVIGPDSVGDRT